MSSTQRIASAGHSSVEPEPGDRAEAGEDLGGRRSLESGSKSANKLSKPFIFVLCSLGVILYSTNSILFVWAKGEESHFHFMLSSVVFLSEILRVLVCLFLLLYNNDSRQLCSSGAIFNNEFFLYAFPAVMYAINDEIAFNCLEYMDSATFQTLSALKIIGTAISCRIFLGKPLNDQQWTALVILTFGSVFAASASHEDMQTGHTSIRTKARFHYSKISNEILLDDDIIVDGKEVELSQQAKKQILTNDSVDAAVKDHRFFVTSRGLLLILVYCMLSSITAAYGEWLLRKRKKKGNSGYYPEESLAMKYLKISIWGCGFSCIHCLIDVSRHRAIHPQDAFLLSGFTFWTYILVINQCFLGVVLSAVIKELGAVIKLFILSVSMLLSMLFAIFYLRILPDFNFCLSVLTIVGALYMYAENYSQIHSKNNDINDNLRKKSKTDRTRNLVKSSRSEGRFFSVRQRALIFASVLFIFFYCINGIQDLRTAMIEEELLKLRKNTTDAKNGDSFDKGVLTTRKTSKEKPLHHGSHYIHKLVAKKRL